MNKNTNFIVSIVLIILGTTATIHTEWVWVEGRRIWRDPVDVAGDIVGGVLDSAFYYGDDPYYHHYHHRRRRSRYIRPHYRSERRYGRRH